MHGRTRVAWNLRRLRVARDVSQENLAVDANVDRSSISGIEGESFNPSVGLLDRLASALSVDIAEFFVHPPLDASPPEPLKAGRRSKA